MGIYKIIQIALICVALTSSKSSTALAKINNCSLNTDIRQEQTWLLSDVIEMYLAHPETFGYDNPHTFSFNHVNTIRTKLAKKWVRNAAIRVFNDYKRSFLELVVNACDSMLPARESVGKFGMGFFSIFSFLFNDQTTGASIVLKTCSKESGGRLTAYQIIFEKAPGIPENVLIKIKSINPAELNNTPGTIVTINQGLKSFSPELISEIERYVHYLDFYDKLQIKLAVGKKISSIGKAQRGRIVYVLLSPNKLEVRDTGTGIPLFTALTKLLIPSSSTKGESDVQAQQQKLLAQENLIQLPVLESFQGKQNSDQSHFLIKINGVIAVNKTLTAVFTNKNGTVVDLLVTMPDITHLTLARDEIQFTGHNQSFEALYFKKLIKKTLHTLLLSNQPSHKVNSQKSQSLDISSLYYFYAALGEWEKQSTSHHMQGVFTEYFKATLDDLLQKNKHILPVPAQHAKVFDHIIASVQSTQKITTVPLSPQLVSYSYSSLEEFLSSAFYYHIHNTLQPKNTKEILLDALSFKLINGHRVYFIQDSHLPQTDQGKATISSFGLRQCIFAPKSLLSTGKNKDSIAQDIMMLSPEHEFSAYYDHTKQPIDLLWGLGNADSIQQFNAIPYPIEMLKLVQKGKASIFTAHDNPTLKQFFGRNKNLIFNHVTLNLFRQKYCYSNLVDDVVIDSKKLTKQLLSKKTWFTDVNNFRGTIHYSHNIIYNQEKDIFYVLGGSTKSYSFDKEIGALFTFLSEQTQESTEQLSEKKLAQAHQKLINFLDRSAALNAIAAISLVDFCNILFEALLYGYGISPNTDTKQILILNGKQHFPCIKTLENIEQLFHILMHHSYMVAPRRYLQKNNSQIRIDEERKRISAIKNQRNTDNNVVFMPLQGVSSSQLINLENNQFKADVTWANTLDKTLSYSIPNIQVNRSIADILSLQLYATMAAKSSSALNEYHDRIRQFKECLLALYNRYLSIPDDEFKRTYGSNESCHAIHPDHDVSVQSLQTLLLALQEQPAAQKKLLAFSLADFASKTAVKARTTDLAHNTLFMPSLCANTPLAVLAKLYKQGISIDVICSLIEKSSSFQELLYISYILHEENNLKLIKESKTNLPALINALEFIIEHFIHEKIDKERIQAAYQKRRSIPSFKERLDYVKNDSTGHLVTTYLKNSLTLDKAFSSQQGFITHAALEALLDHNNTFRLKQLIQAHCSEQGLKDSLEKGQLHKALLMIKQQSGVLDLGKITQDIEMGSEKSYLEGTIIETLQNSVDAIKEFFKNLEKHEPSAESSYQKRINPSGIIEKVFDLLALSEKPSVKKINDPLTTITFKLETVPAPGKDKHIRLTIKDRVGMNLTTLLTNFILPDYSEKSPAQGAVGDMGNGAFKMYQNAQQTTLLTRPLNMPDKCYLLHITPLRSKKNGLVEDLILKVCDVSALVSKQFFGTSIKILMNKHDENSVNMDLLHAQDFLINCVGATQVNIPSIKNTIKTVLVRGSATNPSECIILNQDVISKQTSIFEHKDATGKVLFKIYRRSNPLLQSYVTTNGIPFRPLSSLALQHKLLPKEFIYPLSNGFILDLGPDTYQPVQSRTQVYMTQEYLELVRKSLLDAFFVIGLQDGKDDRAIMNRNFLHYSSTCSSFDQLKLDDAAAQACNKNLDAFVKGNSLHDVISFTDFFTYYRPFATKTSFYDHVVETYRSLIKNIQADHTLHKVSTKQQWSEWLKGHKNEIDKIKQESNVERKKELWLNLKRSYKNFTTPLQQKWALVRDSMYTQWYNTVHNQGITSYPELYFENNDYGLIKTVVIPWFEKKVKALDLIFPKFKNLVPRSTYTHQKNTVIADLVDTDWLGIDAQLRTFLETHGKKVLNGIVKSFCHLFGQKIGMKTSPCASFVYEENETMGYYQPGMHAVSINLYHISLADQLEVIQALLTHKTSSEALSHLSGFIDLYIAKRGYTPTLVHELEHARRSNSHHGSGAHADGVNTEGKRVQFDSCANSYMNLAIKNGLLNEWLQSAQAIAQAEVTAFQKSHPYFDVATYLAMYMWKIQGIQKNDKKFLAKKLGF